ncbi:TPA: terminase small subunit, partial [Streptococcus pyogenes]
MLGGDGKLSKLTLKQKRFADEYIISANATAAAIKAGYSKKTARSIGQENLTKPDIKAYIDERLEKLESEKIATQEEVLQYLTSIMRGDQQEKTLISVGEFGQKIV